MKKLLSLALVLAMVLTMSTTAFAQEIKGESGSTDITYTADESYVVTIPDSMKVGEDATVSVSNVVLAASKQLTVSVSSTQYDNGWKLKNGDDKIGYTLKIDNTDVANNGTVLTAKSGETVTKTLQTTLTGTAKYSGTYTDTLTFTVATATVSDVKTVSSSDDLKTALTSGGKIKLSDSITLSNSGSIIDIDDSTSVELDLNGKKLTLEDSLVIYEGSTLTLSDNASGGQLLLEVNPNIPDMFVLTPAQIKCYGTLVVDGGSYGNKYGFSSILISDEDADVTINGGTIDRMEINYGKLNIIGGQIDYLDAGTYSVVTIAGGQIDYLDTGTYTVVTITGGTFGFDPTEYIDTNNYTVTETTTDNVDTWTVTEKSN